MAKTQINQFWIWILSSAAIIGILLIAFPALHSLSAASPSSPSKPTSNDGTKETHNTIYNPGDSVLQGARSSSERPNFLFEFLERHDIESLDSAADGAWDQAMSTPLGGFLLVKHNETYNLGWGVSMFHSVHCLRMLRATMQNYFGLAAENTGHGTHTHGGRDGATLKVDERTHVEHCLGYIGRVSCLFLLFHTGFRLILTSLLCAFRLCYAMEMTLWSHHLQKKTQMVISSSAGSMDRAISILAVTQRWLGKLCLHLKMIP